MFFATTIAIEVMRTGLTLLYPASELREYSCSMIVLMQSLTATIVKLVRNDSLHDVHYCHKYVITWRFYRSGSTYAQDFLSNMKHSSLFTYPNKQYRVISSVANPTVLHVHL